VNDTVAFSRSPPLDCAVRVPVPVGDTVVRLSMTPVIAVAGIPDSAGIFTTRSTPGTRMPAGSLRES
jgi:hypothetical protein